MSKLINNIYEGFSKLNKKARLQKLLAVGRLTKKELLHLTTKKNLAFNYGEMFIENFIGYYHLPIGVATHFVIDGKDYVIPMAVEETSIIASASKTAKWVAQNGKITTETLGGLAIGQIQMAKVKDVNRVKTIIENHKGMLITKANNNVCTKMVKRGGGVADIAVRILLRDDNHCMVILHVLMNTCDAMGANVINQVCEYLRPLIVKLTGEKVNMCILSNLSDTKLTRATVTIPHVDKALAQALEEASLFAEIDPYRAATSNKGVLNAIDAIAIATGNDWRAIEAGIHAYAAHTGQYRSITTWRLKGNSLVGILTAPINAATRGGITSLHPAAKLCLNMLDIEKASQLSGIMAAAGLIQNLGAIRALTQEGIVQGHMKLHTTNLCLAAGAKKYEFSLLKQQLTKALACKKFITVADAEKLLAEIRQVR